MVTEDFVVSGTCSEQMYGMCESLWEPDMVSVMWGFKSHQHLNGGCCLNPPWSHPLVSEASRWAFMGVAMLDDWSVSFRSYVFWWQSRTMKQIWLRNCGHARHLNTSCWLMTLFVMPNISINSLGLTGWTKSKFKHDCPCITSDLWLTNYLPLLRSVEPSRTCFRLLQCHILYSQLAFWRQKRGVTCNMIYINAGSPLKRFWFYLRRWIRYASKLSLHSASVTFILMMRWGKCAWKLPWIGSANGATSSVTLTAYKTVWGGDSQSVNHLIFGLSMEMSPHTDNPPLTP